MWCLIGHNFTKKMTSIFYYVLLILSFISFVYSLPATSHVIPDYPRQLSLFPRFDQSKSVSVKDEQVFPKVSNKDDFANWASYAVRVMAAKINNTISTIKDKVKKSISKDNEENNEPFFEFRDFVNSGNVKNNSSRNSEKLKIDVQNQGLVNKTIINTTANINRDNITSADMTRDNMTQSEMTRENMTPTDMIRDNMTSADVTPSKMISNNMVEMKLAEQKDGLDTGKSNNSQKLVEAERRQFHVHSFGNPNIHSSHFSLADEPQNYQPFVNYLSHLLGNTHYDLTGNKIIIRAPDYFAPAPTPAAYIPLLVQHQGFPDYQSNHVVKNQFGGGDESKNSNGDLAALKASKGFAASVPSVPPVSSVSSVPSVPSVPSVSFVPHVSSTTAKPTTTTSSTTTTVSTTSTVSPKLDVEYVTKPIKLVDVSGESIKSSATIRPIISVPFEAIITITRDSHLPSSTSFPLITPVTPTTSSLPITLNQDLRNYYEIVTRDPPDEFPPYFKINNTSDKASIFEKDRNNYQNIEDHSKNKFNQGKKKDCDNNNKNNNNISNESSTVNVVFENEIRKEKKMKEDNSDSFKQNKFLDDDFDDDDDFEVTKNKKKQDKDKSRKRQTSIFKQLLQILGFQKKKNRDNNTADIPLTTSPVFKIFTANRFPGAKFEDTPSNRGRRNQTSERDEIPDIPDISDNEVIPIDEKPRKSNDTTQNQEFDDDDDDEEGGSLGSITDLLPLAIPILEDLSDPESDTDLAELLESAIPIIQGLSEGENEDGTPIDITATISPVLQAISAGKDGQDSDSGAILTPIITLVAPFIGTVLGPLIGPLLRSSSNPHSEGSSVTAFIQSISGPLSKPTEPGGTSPLSQLVAGIVAGLSRESSAGGNAGSDIGALISSVVSGTLAGTSAGLSGGSSSGSGSGSSGPPQKPDSYGAYANYGPATVPASSVNTLQLIGSTLKDILGASGTIVSSLFGGISGLLGASSAGSSSEEPSPAYGPPAPSYGPPNYKPPPLIKPPVGLKPPPLTLKMSPINKPSRSTFNRP